jgi:hypothetical protein
MSQTEKLIVWLIPIGVITFLGYLFATPAFLASTDPTYTFLGLDKYQLMLASKIIPNSFSLLQNVVVAVWLYFSSKSAGRNPLVWALFGLTFAFWALIVWLVSQPSKNHAA